jgi:hypothetical protein
MQTGRVLNCLLNCLCGVVFRQAGEVRSAARCLLRVGGEAQVEPCRWARAAPVRPSKPGLEGAEMPPLLPPPPAPPPSDCPPDEACLRADEALLGASADSEGASDDDASDDQPAFVDSDSDAS